MECKSMLTIKGMENISVVGDMKIKISGYENIIKEVHLNKNADEEGKLEIYFIGKEYKNKSCYEIRSLTFKIAKLLVDQLINQDVCFSKVEFDNYKTYERDQGKVSVWGEITITNIDTGADLKVFENAEIVLDGSRGVSKLVSNLEEKDPIQRFENLYERLKEKCGNQIKVTEKMKNEFADLFDIKCDNLNIDSEYAKRHPKAKEQDDFTYLRTMIAHGDKKYSDEIEQRLERDIIKIVKVLKKMEEDETFENSK